MKKVVKNTSITTNVGKALIILSGFHRINLPCGALVHGNQEKVHHNS